MVHFCLCVYHCCVDQKKTHTHTDRILDAPELRCDFYLNLLDWSSKNFIAVALGETVYLWNAVSGAICVLYTNHDSDSYISSLSWANDGAHLAVGMAGNKGAQGDARVVCSYIFWQARGFLFPGNKQTCPLQNEDSAHHISLPRNPVCI